MQVHDELVAHGVDPSSDAYYAAIEHKVAEQLPQKWMQWQAIMAAAASKQPTAAMEYSIQSLNDHVVMTCIMEQPDFALSALAALPF